MKSNNALKALSVVVLLQLFSCAFFIEAVSRAGTIERSSKQQLLASIPPSHEATPTGSSQMFLTSLSGKYAVFLLRRETSVGAGGLGTDFCYIQVQDSGVSVWESECAAVSNANTCSLVFSDAGLEIFDGSRSVWDGDVEDDDAHLEILDLMDSGDMQIRNKEGDLAWKASDSPLANQNCGSIGAPGLSPAHPPFGSPVHGRTGPFGQQVSGAITANQGQQQLGSTAAPLGSPLGSQPSVSTDNQGESPLSSQPSVATDGQVGAPLGSQSSEATDNELGSPLGSQPSVATDGQVGLPSQGEEEQDQDHQGEELADTRQHQNINQPLSAAVNQPFGGGSQHQLPLVDNTPFDSGSSNPFNLHLGLVSLLLAVMGYSALFLF